MPQAVEWDAETYLDDDSKNLCWVTPTPPDLAPEGNTDEGYYEMRELAPLGLSSQQLVPPQVIEFKKSEAATDTVQCPDSPPDPDDDLVRGPADPPKT